MTENGQIAKKSADLVGRGQNDTAVYRKSEREDAVCSSHDQEDTVCSSGDQ
jgi:hypothetical protein